MPLNRRCPIICAGASSPLCGVGDDHPPRVDNPGHLALVVAPQVGGYKFTKVLMDGGSSINILYYETFRRMGLTDKNLKPSNTVFHGVVPGKLAYPVGKIALDVAFGDEHDSRSEKLTFEVVKIQSLYLLAAQDAGLQGDNNGSWESQGRFGV